MSVKLNRKAARILGRLARLCVINAALLLTVSIVTRSAMLSPSVLLLADGVGELCAAAVLPGGKADMTSRTTIAPITSTAAAKTTAEKTKATTTPGTRAVVAAADAAGRILTQTIGLKSANLTAKNLHISNKTGVSVNLNSLLKTPPDVHIESGKSPQVLIVHTHGTESYYPANNGSYKSSWQTSSTDTSKSVVAVGAAVAKRLNAAGIATIHDKTQYDKLAYSGSYERARTATKQTLDKYKSIQVVLDLHRDSITSDNGDKLKPTATIAKKSAAQLMIATGCQSGAVTEYPDWKHNFRFACAVQRQCEQKYPGLVRPMYFVSKKYNHDLCRGSLLVEFGSEANTLTEALYSAQLFSDALIAVLNGLK